jgi:outer membrane receptor protein involved in Fe transport
LQDGISYNNRFTNSLDLNLIQSEDVDSIEIISLPRGFLYGSHTNPVSVNFITKDFLTAKPYSRIKYYQGSNRELMFDGIFNAQLINKLILSFDITNKIYDSTYDNTSYTIWQGKVQLKYLLSNSFNVIASYNYNYYRAGFNGGIDVDTIIALGKDLNTTLYDSQLAPVIYPNGKGSSITHLPKLQFLIKPTENIKTDVSIFYLYSDNSKITQASQYWECKTLGVNFRNDYNTNLFNAQLIVNYESDRINLWELKRVDTTMQYSTLPYYDKNLFSAAGNISFPMFDSVLIPSVFGKYSLYKNKSVPFLPNILFEPHLDESINSFSVGFDLSYKASQTLSFYIGGSLPQFMGIDESSQTFEAGGKYSNDFLYLNLKLFGYNGYNNYGNLFFSAQDINQKLFGSGIILKFKCSFLLLESNSSFYFNTVKDELYNVPEFQTQSGLYYSSTLFNNNLDLKTGFIFYFTGENKVYTPEHGSLSVLSSNKLDFTLAGEIQKTAIIYFTWQNLFNSNYYLTPYYPMSSRSIRFGVAWELFN